MTKKAKGIICTSIIAVLTIVAIIGVVLLNKPAAIDSTVIIQAYKKTVNTYFGNGNVDALQQMLPNSVFTVQCNDQTSKHFINAHEKQIANTIEVKNEFSASTVDLQFYVFDKHFAVASNALIEDHAYGINIETIEQQLKNSNLLGFQGLSAKTVLADNQEKFDNFKQSTDGLWLIGQTTLENILSSSDMQCKREGGLITGTFLLNTGNEKEITRALFGASASNLQYLAKHTEYLLMNDDVYKYKELIGALYSIAGFVKDIEAANAVDFVVDEGTGFLSSISFKNGDNNIATILFVQENGKNQITLKSNNALDRILNFGFTNNETNITVEVESNDQCILAGNIRRQTEVNGYQTVITSVLAKGEMEESNISFSLSSNNDKSIQMPNYIDIGSMDIDATMHFFENMSNFYAEGFDEIANIFLYEPMEKSESDYIDLPTQNIYQGEIVLVDDASVTVKIVKVDTETAEPSLVFEMTNKTDKRMYFIAYGMQIQNKQIDLNTGMDVNAGETQSWGVLLTKENIGFALNEIDSIYFPQIVIQTDEEKLFELTQTVELKSNDNVTEIELPETLIYNAASFKIYAKGDIVITENGVQTTVVLVNNSSRNTYIDIDAGKVNDITGECVEYFPCYANTVSEKTLLIKGNFTDMTIEDVQKICFELYIRDRDQSQLTGLQSMEISFVENAEG